MKKESSLYGILHGSKAHLKGAPNKGIKSSYPPELMDRLAKILEDLSDPRYQIPVHKRGNQIYKAMMERDAEMNLEEFVSWIELIEEDESREESA